MSVSSAPAPGPPIAGTAERAADGGGPERGQVRALAQEFESLLILQMVKQMRQTFLEEEEPGRGLGAETMTETLDAELARALARQGGIGLASFIERGMARAIGLAAAGGPDGVGASDRSVVRPTAGPRATGPSREPDASGPGAPLPPGSPLAAGVPGGSASTGSGRAIATPGSPRPDDVALRSAAAPAAPSPDPPAGLIMPLDTATSSPFGWRADPFHGQQKFHAGVDFRAAYGREVPVAAAGRVSYAGRQGAYGLTVVVNHDDGVQTRYAHLSTLDVRAGQELAAGELVGRVGQSGRATGPHLHFEVVVDGRRVDPALAAARLPGGLKLATDRDDFLVEAVPAATAGDGSE